MSTSAASTMSQESLVNGLNTSHLNEGENIETPESTAENPNIFDLSNDIELQLDTLMDLVEKNDAENEERIDTLLKRVVKLEQELSK